MAQQVIISALFRLLRPLVRILLRQGLSVDAFEDIARRMYVDVAEKDFALAGKKQTSSRIGVLTGLNRKEVARLLRQPLIDDDGFSAPHNRAERVLTSWLRDPDFLDEKGDPLTLPFAGDHSFSELVRRYSGDMPARAVAEELVRLGLLREDDNDRLRMVARGYVPDAQSEELIAILGVHCEDWLNTFDHNMTHSREEARFQRQVIYEGIPEKDAEAFRDLSARWGQRVLEELDRWLAQKQQEKSESEPTVRLGLGIYQIQTLPSELGKD